MRNVFAAAFVLGCLLAWAVNVNADGPVYVERYTGPAPMSTVRSYSSPSNSTAQGVAEMMARSGSCRHFGGNSGYEGVGMSSSGPDAALNACCYSRSGMRVVDQGVAFRNGRWYACKRYAR